MFCNAGSAYPLIELARALGGKVSGSAVEKIKIDSLISSGKEATKGSLFVAVKGVKSDGHDFLEQAFAAGAAAAVVSDASKLAGKPGIIVSDTRQSLSRLAALFCENPSQKMQVVGITGTKGKTTINWILYHLLNQAFANPCVRIGTLGVKTEKGFELPGNLTTPDALEIQSSLKRSLELGVSSCVMEVSSHALDQYRADDVQFDVAVFTNLTRDHLDYHKDMDSYLQAKSRLFDLVAQGSKKTRAAAINLDSAQGQTLQRRLKEWQLNDFSFGRSEDAQIRICDFSQTFAGSRVELEYKGKRYPISTRFIGNHNAENIAAAFAAAVALGYEAAQVAGAIEKVPQVPGRLEAVGNADLSVFVDYAHTPDALEKALLCLREVLPRKLWVVFGCGGDRDRGKRPQMAQIASQLADHVTVTSDNPRTEEPLEIIKDILTCEAAEKIKREGIVEPDRRLAIEKTVLRAGKGDVILIAGKGHEDYQIIGTTKYHFSDQEEVRKVLGQVVIDEHQSFQRKTS